PAAQAFTPKTGLGVSATVSGRDVRVGSVTFMRELAPDAFAGVERLVGQGGASVDSQVVVAVNGRPAGLIVLHDALRPGAADAVESLRSLGIKTILLLTGDDQRTAAAIADQAGIVPEAVYAGLLPDEKLRCLKEAGGETLMVGDGV